MNDQPHITGSTKYIGLIGSSVRYSLSPVVHNAAFKEMGLDYAYVAFDVDPINLLDAMRGMKALGFLGYNVTAPLKKAIVPYLDEVSKVAELCDAVNTVVIQNGRLLGDNGDGSAFMRTLVMDGVNILGKKITVLGAGGTGSAIVAQAALDGVAQIDLYNRMDDFFAPAQGLIERVSEVSDTEIMLRSLDDAAALRRSLAESQLVVNATTVGEPQNPGCLLGPDMLHPGLVVAEMVYVPQDTELVRMAADAGNKVIDGADVFLQQASMGERLWLGREMPIDFIAEEFFED